jgi:titin
MRKLWLGLLFAGSTLSGSAITILVTTTNDTGAGSFRQAIVTANSTAGSNAIVFQITGTPPFTIKPANALNAITAPVVIDATTQPGYGGMPVVELNGAATGAGTVGLRFEVGVVSAPSTLRGLAINRFPGQEVELDSASNNIQGNFIGTDVTGTVARGGGVGSDGILVNNSSGNLIGGTNSGDGNVISGGNDTGVYLLDANGNTVQGNFIGVTAAGSAALGNLKNGIVVYGSSSNLIGGPVAAARNVVAGNGASGIYLIQSGPPATTGNVILGNYVGTDRAGGVGLGNQTGDGVTLIGAPGNLVVSNLISANILAGISISGNGASSNQVSGNFIGTDAAGSFALGNTNGVTIFSGAGGNLIGGTSAGAGNLISGNFQNGIFLTGGTGTNLVQGNLIGLAVAGTSALPNGYDGITISGATANTIGGTVFGARNIISGNAYHGVGILLLTDVGNAVLGNDIGTDVTGTQAVGNAVDGILIQAGSNTIGGVVTGAGNVISGNGQYGINLTGTKGNVSGNLIQGNFIGVDATGAGRLGNATAGLGIFGAAGNQIGGTTAGARNVISANGNNLTQLGGVYVANTGATGNQFQGNYIGTDASGKLVLGNVNDGIDLYSGASTNLIGGSASGAGNLISANGVDGIYLYGATWNTIQGNDIGTQADGTSALGNIAQNVELELNENANNNTIGGSLAGAGNHIAFALYYSGIRIRNGNANNLISGNSIFGNAALGIDLGAYGVTPNVPGENGVPANTANAGQNYPVLTNVYSGTSTRIRGFLDGKAGKTYALQFFASPTGNASGYGEGQIFLGQTNLTLGSTNFTAYVPAAVPPGWVVTATATDISNNTSEFSSWVPSLSVPLVAAVPSGLNQLGVVWTNNGGSFILQQTPSLTPPANWITVLTAPVLATNFLVATLPTTNGSMFYRLQAQ